MAQIDSSGRGRTTHVELNLVPFIDLMSVLITFLLISAVWTQVSMIQLGASFASPQDNKQINIKPPISEDLILKLDVMTTGYVLTFGSEIKPIPKLNNVYDTEKLVGELMRIKKIYPDKAGLKISFADDIVYENVIATMDAGLKVGFAPELLTGGPQ